MSTNTNTRAMLVNLNISMWTARKYDSKVSKQVETVYSAENSGRYNKILIATEYISNIQKVVNAARTYHYENTLPWFDTGGRLLPTANYFEYTGKMQNFQIQFEQMVKDFISLYPDYIAEASIRLGGMYNDADYPDVSELPKKYGFKVQILPVPDADDFRVTMNEDDIRNIKDDLEREMEENTNAAMKDIWNRLYKTVNHVVEKLSDVDAKFKDSLIGNVREMCDLLPRLNVTNDKKLDDMVAEVGEKLADLSPKDLRTDSAKRYSAAISAKKMLDKMADYAVGVK